MTIFTRPIIVLGAGLLICGLCLPPAIAVEPPPVNPSALPKNDPPRPLVKTEQREVCTSPLAKDSESINEVPEPQAALQLTSLWPLSTGTGQTVAVIDTGVNRHPRLRSLAPGGDYVFTGDGLDDCDAHGTLVAGIIAASPDPSGTSAFAGVAPNANLISIRQSSSKYSPSDSRSEDPNGKNSSGYGNVETLAMAIRHAADLGATVINISEVACTPANSGLNDRAVGAAVQYAVDVRDVVIVAAAGNLDGGGSCSAQNPGIDPLNPAGDLYDSVLTIASPAWYDDYVLTVGSVQPDGSPSQFSLAGPWVDVAAVGVGVTSLSSVRGSTGLVNAYPGSNGPAPIAGTSFAAPVVSGVAALIRSRYPQLKAKQVMARIESTAHSPAEGWNPAMGHGVVDAFAALTADLSDSAASATKTVSTPLVLPPAEPAPDQRPKRYALLASAICAGALVLGSAILLPLRRRFLQQTEQKTKV
ncbi:MAG: type VII secretion-associated serine protease mycosin [Mycobacteriaceae bacterium]